MYGRLLGEGLPSCAATLPACRCFDSAATPKVKTVGTAVHRTHIAYPPHLLYGHAIDHITLVLTVMLPEVGEAG